MATTKKESNFVSNINFKIDINKVYSDFLKDIDNVRSLSSISNPENKKNIDEIIKKSNGDITSIAGIVKAEKTPQESRCHAFYRLIGLPVVSNDMKIYNPGLDIVYDGKREERKNTKLTIARNPLNNFNQFSVLRENYPLASLSVFSTPDNVNAGALALLSGGTHRVRRFSEHLEKITGPFDVDFNSQTYLLDHLGRVGPNDTIPISEYRDFNGKTPDKNVVSPLRAHLIFPLIVDARIDLSINPPNNLVAVPFISDRNQLKVSSGDSNNQSNSQIDKSVSRNPSLPSHVRRPLIEKIIRQRFAEDNKKKQASTNVDSVSDFVRNYPDIRNLSIIDKVNRNSVYNPTEQAQFLTFMQIIASMTYTLAKAENEVMQAQSAYYWLPKPSSNGPEEGFSIRGLFLPKFVIDERLQTYLDREIIMAITLGVIDSVTPATVNADGTTVDVGHFAFDNLQQTFHPETSGAFGNINFENKEGLIQKRTRVLGIANNALRTIEIIMGEFSGLGLCDIIAIIGALYIIDKNDLLGFLDTYSMDRLNAIPEFKGIIANQPSYETSMTNLMYAIIDFYNLMQAWYTSIKVRNNMKPGQ
jgi:hypothetical protein